MPTTPAPIPPRVPQGPFPEPTPKPQPIWNLSPAPGVLGLLFEGMNPGSNFGAPEDIVVSWQVRNSGQNDITDPFSVELRMEDAVLAQWRVDRLPRQTFVFVEQVEGLFAGFDIVASEFHVSLVIDPLNEINETNELDNTVLRTLGLFDSQSVPAVPPELLPNFAPVPVEGKVEPIFVSSHADDPLSGKLSVDRPSVIEVRAGNRSIHYIDQEFDLDLYFDDMLLRRLTWEDVGAGRATQFSADDLRDLVDISPGPHTLRIVADPLNRIRESDETDNEYEIELVWGVGEVDPPDEPFVIEPPDREPTTRANLMPYRRFGWDAAIAISTDADLLPEGSDGHLEVSKAARIDFGFTNESRFSLPLTSQLTADVLLDGELVERRRFSSGSSNVGAIWTDSVILPGNTVSAGEHTVRVVLDPDNLFDELAETDNVFERTFTWHEGPGPDTAAHFDMSDQGITEALEPLFGELRREVRPVLGPGSGERDWTPEIRDAGRAIYFLLTGRDVDAEGYELHFLGPDQFRNGAVATCMSDWVTMSVSEYEEAFEICTRDRGEIGFKTRANGQVHIFVDLGLSPLDALGTYLHELGHGLQDLVNPEQSELPVTINTRGLFEAQAQAFEAAGWRAAEEFMGERLGLFPDVPAARDRFDLLFEIRRNRGTEHDIGYRMLWTQALSFGPGFGITERLRTDGQLDADHTLSLFDMLVNLPARDVETWADAMLARADLMDEYQQIASQRFVVGLDAASTGHTALQEAMWLAP